MSNLQQKKEFMKSSIKKEIIVQINNLSAILLYIKSANFEEHN